MNSPEKLQEYFENVAVSDIPRTGRDNRRELNLSLIHIYARGTGWLEDFLRDCRYGLRMLRRNPAFACFAILSLALGIGADTAIFSLMDRVMFRMMPVREPQRLVQITRFHPPFGAAYISYPLFQSFQKELGSFDGLLAHYKLNGADIRIDGSVEAANFDLVSGYYFRVLGLGSAKMCIRDRSERSYGSRNDAGQHAAGR